MSGLNVPEKCPSHRRTAKLPPLPRGRPILSLRRITLPTDGDFAWAVKMGAAGVQYAQEIAVNDTGSVYVTGYFGGTVDFDPGPAVTNLTSAGYSDLSVAKYYVDGSFARAKRAGASSQNEYGFAGAVYALGWFGGTCDFDPGPGTLNLTTDWNYIDAFVAKLDANGAFEWVRQPETVSFADDKRAFSVAADAAGNVHVMGHYRYPVDFNPGPRTATLTS